MSRSTLFSQASFVSMIAAGVLAASASFAVAPGPVQSSPPAPTANPSTSSTNSGTTATTPGSSTTTNTRTGTNGTTSDRTTGDNPDMGSNGTLRTQTTTTPAPLRTLTAEQKAELSTGVKVSTLTDPQTTLVGSTLFTSKGEAIGEVSSVAMNGSGKVSTVKVALSNGQSVNVQTASLTFVQAQNALVTKRSRTAIEHIKRAP